jgi:hypothetical protein
MREEAIGTGRRLMCLRGHIPKEMLGTLMLRPRTTPVKAVIAEVVEALVADNS